MNKRKRERMKQRIYCREKNRSSKIEIERRKINNIGNNAYIVVNHFTKRIIVTLTLFGRHRSSSSSRKQYMRQQSSKQKKLQSSKTTTRTTSSNTY